MRVGLPRGSSRSRPRRSSPAAATSSPGNGSNSLGFEIDKDYRFETYARGADALWGMYPWLDRAPKGRNETGPWFRHHDE